MVRYYFDTSIWLDIHEERGYNGEVAKELIQNIIFKDHVIVFSNFIERELKHLGFSKNEIGKIIRVAKPNKIKHVHLTKYQLKESIRVAKQRNVPLGDAVHAILARDHESKLVSRDRDFQKLKDITRVYLPEEL
jgi:predicted nucleic acid-binding protein